MSERNLGWIIVRFSSVELDLPCRSPFQYVTKCPRSTNSATNESNTLVWLGDVIGVRMRILYASTKDVIDKTKRIFSVTDVLYIIIGINLQLLEKQLAYHRSTISTKQEDRIQ